MEAVSGAWARTLSATAPLSALSHTRSLNAPMRLNGRRPVDKHVFDGFAATPRGRAAVRGGFRGILVGLHEGEEARRRDGAHSERARTRE